MKTTHVYIVLWIALALAQLVTLYYEHGSVAITLTLVGWFGGIVSALLLQSIRQRS